MMLTHATTDGHIMATQSREKSLVCEVSLGNNGDIYVKPYNGILP